MRLIDKKRLTGLYNTEVSYNVRIIDLVLELCEAEKKFTFNQCLKLALLIALKQKAINEETMLLEWACIDAFWENEKPKYPLMCIPETGKLATQK